MSAAAIDVAIVGGGPAGLGAALALKERGVARVVVLEREATAGGVPRHCAHSPYGLREFHRRHGRPGLCAPPRRDGARGGRRDSHRHERRDARPRRHADDHVRCRGRRDSPPGASSWRRGRARRRAPPASSAATGRPASSPPGRCSRRCISEHLRPFARPLIVGTELVALSALITCRQAGIRPVAVVEAGARPSVAFPLGLFPRLLGIPLHLATAIVEIRGRSARRCGRPARRGGRLREIACDGVVFTGRFVPEAALVRAGHLVLDTATGGPAIDDYGRTSDPRDLRGRQWRHGRSGRRAGAIATGGASARMSPPIWRGG